MTASPLLLGTAVLLSIGISLGYLVFWQRLRPIFWFTCALTVVGTGYLVATGAAERLAYGIWPELNPETRRVVGQQLSSQVDTFVGMWLIAFPLGIALFFVWWRHKVFLRATLLFMGALMALLHMSSFPAHLARAAIPGHVLDQFSIELARR